MSRARDIIQEIAEMRKRRQFDSSNVELVVRLSALERAFNGHDHVNTELTRYFPVALVACIEGYFRLSIRELIDAGDPYLTNAERLASSIKFDLMVIRAIHGKAVTVGEIVAHSVPLSRLDHIESSMSHLLGNSFLERMRTTTDRWNHKVGGAPIKPLLADPDSVFSGVAKAFELRHIICHEIASAHEIQYSDVSQCFESCVSFLRSADELILEILYPGAPLTQSDMNAAAGKSLSDARQIMEKAMTELREQLSGDDLKTFEEAQNCWEKYCSAWADFEAIDVKGGSIWSTIRARCEEALVRNRINELCSYEPSR